MIRIPLKISNPHVQSNMEGLYSDVRTMAGGFAGSEAELPVL